MRFVLFLFTIAAYATLFLQFACPKGGVWHRRRALLIAILPLPPILWNIAALARTEIFFSGWNMIHTSFGIFFYYFWLRTIHLGVYATEHATSTVAHERSAWVTLASAIGVFLVPFVWRLFAE